MRRLALFIIVISVVACDQEEKAEQTMESNPYYNEQYRLQLHFSPEAHWMNDPNGLVYIDGKYNLFYQYYPDSTVWGPMHWGHAISTDLVHWQHLPIALYPDSLGYIFSGSAVYDRKNTSGLGNAEQPPLVAIFTYHDPVGAEAGTKTFQTQGMAYSLDKGKTWTKYEHNPILNNPGIIDFRDPKVFWMETQKKWVMSLAVKDHISFYSSPDLKTWTLESDFGQTLGGHGGVWECPDLIKLDGHWVLLVSINPGGPNGGSATQYFVGDFDGSRFTPYDSITRWIDYGRDNYAGVTWSNIPVSDDKTLFIGWMSNWNYAQEVPTSPWRSAMTVPRTLSLLETSNGYILKSYPVKELEALRSAHTMINEASSKNVDINNKGFTTYDLNLRLENKLLPSNSFAIELYNTLGDTLSLGYNADSTVFFINRDRVGDNDFSDAFAGLQKADFQLTSDHLTIRMIVDVGSVEVFVNDGELVMTSLFFPKEPLNGARFINLSDKQYVTISGDIYEMNGIWNE